MTRCPHSVHCLPCSDDEDVTCAVCDRSFPTPVHLEAHMVKHRHWLCSTCDTLFNSVVQLEYHKVRSTNIHSSISLIFLALN